MRSIDWLHAIFNTSLLRTIAWPLLFVTLYASVVAGLDLVLDWRWELTNQITPLLSVLLGLLLVFRNTSAYARWDNGKTLFTGLTTTVRLFAKGIWVHVGLPQPPASPHVSAAEIEEDLRGKRIAIRMCVAFVVATRHHLRNEFEWDYPDLKALLPEKFFHSALYANRHAPDASNYTSSTPSRSNYHSPSSTIKQRTGEMSPLLHQTVHDPDSFLSSTLLLPIPHPTFPLPLIISHQLSLYLTFLQAQQKMESLGSAGYNAMHQLNSDLVRAFTACERLERGGVPRVYGVHLRQGLALFLMTLPFTLIEALGWKMPFAVGLVAFILIGIESIASELEYPFGTDPNDLPLDEICEHLQQEMEYFISGKFDWRAEEKWF